MRFVWYVYRMIYIYLHAVFTSACRVVSLYKRARKYVYVCTSQIVLAKVLKTGIAIRYYCYTYGAKNNFHAIAAASRVFPRYLCGVSDRR